MNNHTLRSELVCRCWDSAEVMPPKDLVRSSRPHPMWLNQIKYNDQSLLETSFALCIPGGSSLKSWTDSRYLMGPGQRIITAIWMKSVLQSLTWGCCWEMSTSLISDIILQFCPPLISSMVSPFYFKCQFDSPHPFIFELRLVSCSASINLTCLHVCLVFLPLI